MQIQQNQKELKKKTSVKNFIKKIERTEDTQSFSEKKIESSDKIIETLDISENHKKLLNKFCDKYKITNKTRDDLLGMISSLIKRSCDNLERLKPYEVEREKKSLESDRIEEESLNQSQKSFKLALKSAAGSSLDGPKT